MSSKRSKGYHKILAWQRAHELTLAVYGVVEGFPRYEQFGLAKQLRDAVVSVPGNIVEGYGRNTTRQYLYHLFELFYPPIPSGSSGPFDSWSELDG